MDSGILFSFLGISILLSLMPGPDNIFVLTESLTKGYKNGIAISIGLGAGIIVHTTAAATGLSLILVNSVVLFSLIKYAGAAYLLYLAYQMSQNDTDTLAIKQLSQAENFQFLPLIRKGFMMNLLNPKVSLFFIAFLPQFVRTDSNLLPALQMMILGIVFMMQALVVFSGIAILAGQLTPLVTRPSFWKITKWATIFVLTALGVSLALSK